MQIAAALQNLREQILYYGETKTGYSLTKMSM